MLFQPLSNYIEHKCYCIRFVCVCVTHSARILYTVVESPFSAPGRDILAYLFLLVRLGSTLADVGNMTRCLLLCTYVYVLCVRSKGMCLYECVLVMSLI